MFALVARRVAKRTLVGTTADAGPPTSSTNAARIGSDANWNFQSPALIDEVRIWNVARTQNEVKSTMAAPIAANATGLLDVWHFDGDASDAGVKVIADQGALALLIQFPLSV